MLTMILFQDDHQQLKHISKFIQESVAGPLKHLLKVHGHIFKKVEAIFFIVMIPKLQLSLSF